MKDYWPEENFVILEIINSIFSLRIEQISFALV